MRLDKTFYKRLKCKTDSTSWVKRVILFFIESEYFDDIAQQCIFLRNFFSIFYHQCCPLVFFSQSIEHFLFVSEPFINLNLLLHQLKYLRKCFSILRGGQSRGDLVLQFFRSQFLRYFLGRTQNFIVFVEIVDELRTETAFLGFFLYKRSLIGQWLIFEVSQEFGCFHVSLFWLLNVGGFNGALIENQIMSQTKNYFLLSIRILWRINRCSRGRQVLFRLLDCSRFRQYVLFFLWDRLRFRSRLMASGTVLSW